MNENNVVVGVGLGGGGGVKPPAQMPKKRVPKKLYKNMKKLYARRGSYFASKSPIRRVPLIFHILNVDPGSI